MSEGRTNAVTGFPVEKTPKRDPRGRYLKGSTGNPNGTHGPFRLNSTLAQMCRDASPEIFDRMLAVIRRGHDRDAVAAGTVLLAYGFGRPAAAVDVLALHKFVGSLSPEQLKQLGAQVLELEAREAIVQEASADEP